MKITDARLRNLERLRTWIAPGLLLITSLLLWEGLVRLIAVPVYILPGPFQVATALWQYRLPLWDHLQTTLMEIGMGIFVSVLLGVALAVAMFFSRALKQALYPWLVASQTIPYIAIAPVLVLWFGYGLAPKVIVVLLISFFPVVVNVYDGLTRVPEAQVDLLRAMGASPWQIFHMLRIPHALPSFFTGLRITVSVSVIGAVVGEWVGARAGLGYFVNRMSAQMKAPGVFAGVIVLAVLGMTLFQSVSWLEDRLTPGGPPNDRSERG